MEIRVSGSSRKREHDEERNGDKDPFTNPSASQVLVLSSQTQDVDMQPLEAFADLSPAVLTFKLPPLPERNLSVVGDSDSDGFIHSSQSQHMLPHHISPRRKSADQRLLDSVRSLLDESTLEIVPSSQSQTEIEMNVTMRISDYFPHDIPGIRAGCVHARVVCTLLMRCIRKTKNSSDRNDLPSAGCSSYRRTLSDELSPVVPIQAITLTNEGRTDGLDLVPVDPVDSTTEDESEDESSNRHTHETAPTRIGRAAGEATLGGEILEETAEYINSLPNTVQDFEVMFGESSGSLPGDFPMSLR
jgi:hypothetical protein